MIKPGLCVGLDTQDYERIINTVKADVFKVNPAFNPNSTKDIAKLLNDRNIPWIYDAKLGDVMHTNAYYAKYVFEELFQILIYLYTHWLNYSLLLNFFVLSKVLVKNF